MGIFGRLLYWYMRPANTPDHLREDKSLLELKYRFQNLILFNKKLNRIACPAVRRAISNMFEVICIEP